MPATLHPSALVRKRSHGQNHRLLQFVGYVLLVFHLNGAIDTEQNGLNPRKRLTQYIVDDWTVDNGLPNNSILDIEKTSDGYLWLATYGGLARFDGTDFKQFPELRDVNGIRTLMEDSDGSLWVGSDDGALIKYKANTFTFLEVDPALSGASITAISEDGRGKIWVGTRGGMAYVRDGRLEKLDDYQLSTAFVYSVEVDAFDNVWIGTSGSGLFKYSDDSLTQYTTEQGLTDNSIRSICFDTQGQLIIGSEGGLTFFKDGKATRSFTTTDGLPHNYINEILEDSGGTIWLGTDNGLVRFQDGEFEMLDQNTGLADNTVQALHEDQIGILWAGTYRGGLNRLKDGKFINYGVQEGLNDELVYVTRSDESKIWIGSDNGLAYLEHGKITSIQLGNDPSQNTVKDILRDSKGNLWLGTSDGLLRYDKGRIVQKLTTKQGLSNNRVRRIVEDRDGNLWIGTAKGLNKYSVENGKLRGFGLNEGLFNEFILSLLVDTNNRIWVGTNGGGLFQQGKDGFETMSETNGFDSNIVFALSEDDDGYLWISSNAGIAQFDKERFKPITRENGLPSNTVFQIKIQDDYLWLFTDKGLVRVDRDEARQVLEGESVFLEGIRLLNKSEGMRVDQVTGVSLSDIHTNGNILVSTLKGLSILNPSELNIGDDPTKVKMTTVIADGLEFSDHGNISFESGTRYYEFHYTGLNFYSPEKVKFKYRLRNFDDSWVEVGNRRIAYYSNIPPGDYTFEVLASNSDGVWNHQPVSLTFTQKAYFYQTPLFYIILFVTLVAGIFSIYQARLRLLRHRNRQLKEQVTVKTADVEKQNEELKRLNHIKDRLFSIISHDLRGPIDSFYSLLEFLNSGKITETEFKSLSSSLTTKVMDVKELLDELLNWSKSQLDGLTINRQRVNLKEIVAENFKLFEIQASHKQLTLENTLPDSEYVISDLNMTKVIVRNLISNAIKFSENKGKIIVMSSALDGMIEYSVKDNGVGISQENQKKIFDTAGYTTAGTKNEIGTGIGLMLVKEFVEKNEGAVSVTSEEGVGSTFKFTLPTYES